MTLINRWDSFSSEKRGKLCFILFIAVILFSYAINIALTIADYLHINLNLLLVLSGGVLLLYLVTALIAAYHTYNKKQYMLITIWWKLYIVAAMCMFAAFALPSDSIIVRCILYVIFALYAPFFSLFYFDNGIIGMLFAVIISLTTAGSICHISKRAFAKFQAN